MKEKKLPDGWEAYLGPVAVAQFIAMDWLREWPLTLTAKGHKAIRDGWGIWQKAGRMLPMPTAAGELGFAAWEGRRG